jgi:hypothetical protein
MDEEKRRILKDHSVGLRSQIQKNEEFKKQDRLDYLEEGRKVRQKMEDEKKKLEDIKFKKLDGLQSLGIHDKYTAELARKKIQ